MGHQRSVSKHPERDRAHRTWAMRWKLPEPAVGTGLIILFCFCVCLQMSITSSLERKGKRKRSILLPRQQKIMYLLPSLLPCKTTTQEQMAVLRRQGCCSRALRQRRKGRGTPCVCPGAALVHRVPSPPFRVPSVCAYTRDSHVHERTWVT